MILITELQSVGNITYWCNLVKCSKIIFEHHEHFQKTGYRNRYQILSAAGPLTLTVPINGGRQSRLPIKEVTIDNSYKWQKIHIRGLESCYNKSPFFFYYQPYLERFYTKAYKWLWDFNEDIFYYLQKALNLKSEIGFTEKFEKDYSNYQILDGRNQFKPSNRQLFHQKPYLQVFGNNFQQNLSLFDLLFNLGPESRSYLDNQDFSYPFLHLKEG